MLESACMKEEPVPMISQGGMMGGQQAPQQIVGMPLQSVGAPVANMGAMQQHMQALASRGMQPMSGMREARIDEMHEGI